MHVTTRGSQLYLHGRLTQVPYGNGVLNTHMHTEILETANTLPKQHREQGQSEPSEEFNLLFRRGNMLQQCMLGGRNSSFGTVVF